MAIETKTVTVYYIDLDSTFIPHFKSVLLYALQAVLL